MEDIDGALANGHMLSAQGIISTADQEQIVSKLPIIRRNFIFSRDFDDIHTNINLILQVLIGAIAGRLHTVRSRHDQVATGFRPGLRADKVVINRRAGSTFEDRHRALREKRRHNPIALAPRAEAIGDHIRERLATYAHC